MELSWHSEINVNHHDLTCYESNPPPTTVTHVAPQDSANNDSGQQWPPVHWHACTIHHLPHLPPSSTVTRTCHCPCEQALCPSHTGSSEHGRQQLQYPAHAGTISISPCAGIVPLPSHMCRAALPSLLQCSMAHPLGPASLLISPAAVRVPHTPTVWGLLAVAGLAYHDYHPQ